MSEIRPISELVTDDFPSFSPSLSNTSTSTNNTANNLFGISWQTWIIIILLLALLGINVFAYLAKGTEEATNIFGPVLRLFGYTTLTTTKEVIENSATGAKAGVDIVADTATDTIDTITQSQRQSSQTSQNDTVMKALTNNHNRSETEVMPDDSRSSIQTIGKAGWCYIGEDQGVRTCAQVGVNDGCMSGEVFPNQAVCVNPSLRV